MCSTVQEQITTCGQNAIVKIGERINIRPQKAHVILVINTYAHRSSLKTYSDIYSMVCFGSSLHQYASSEAK